MAEAHALPRLLKGILVPVNLREDGAELHLEARDDDELAHAVADGALLEIQVVHAEVVKRLVNAAGALLEHLHLLVAQRHVVEHHEKVKLVAPAGFEIDHVHDTIRLLQEIQSTLVLLSLDEAVCAVVQLGQYDRDLVFGDAKLFIIVLIEGVVLVNGRILALVSLMGASDGRCLSSVRHSAFLHRPSSL